MLSSSRSRRTRTTVSLEAFFLFAVLKKKASLSSSFLFVINLQEIAKGSTNTLEIPPLRLIVVSGLDALDKEHVVAMQEHGGAI